MDLQQNSYMTSQFFRRKMILLIKIIILIFKYKLWFKKFIQQSIFIKKPYRIKPVNNTCSFILFSPNGNRHLQLLISKIVSLHIVYFDTININIIKFLR